MLSQLVKVYSCRFSFELWWVLLLIAADNLTVLGHFTNRHTAITWTLLIITLKQFHNHFLSKIS